MDRLMIKIRHFYKGEKTNEAQKDSLTFQCKTAELASTVSN